MRLTLYHRADRPVDVRLERVLHKAEIADPERVALPPQEHEARFATSAPILSAAGHGVQLVWPFKTAALSAWAAGVAAVVPQETVAPEEGRPLPAAEPVARSSKLESWVENTLFEVFAYVVRAAKTTFDAFARPVSFADAIPSEKYNKPTTYLVVALFLDTLTSSALLVLEGTSAQSKINRDAASSFNSDLAGGALGGDWMSVLFSLAPILVLAALFSVFLHLFTRKRYGGDFRWCFMLTSYSIAAPSMLRALLMASLIPAMAGGASFQGGIFETCKAVIIGLAIVCQFVPIALLLIYLSRWVGGFREALLCWLAPAVATVLVALCIGAWTYPLWAELILAPAS